MSYSQQQVVFTTKKRTKKQSHSIKNKQLSKASKEETKTKLIIDKKKEVLSLYLRDKYLNIILDLYLLFVLGLTYSAYLILTEPRIGWIFLIFTIICSLIIGGTYYFEIKREVDIVLKDLDIIFK
jgi:hypothetical protein